MLSISQHDICQYIETSHNANNNKNTKKRIQLKLSTNGLGSIGKRRDAREASKCLRKSHFRQKGRPEINWLAKSKSWFSCFFLTQQKNRHEFTYNEVCKNE